MCFEIKKIFPLMCILLLCVLVLGAVFFFLFYTPHGARFLADRFLQQFLPAGQKSVEQVAGTFSQSVSLKNIEIKELAGFLPGSVLKVQQLDIVQPHLDIARMSIKVENARLLLPSGDPIVLSGTCENNILDVHLFSKSINVGQVLSLVPDLKLPAGLKGRLADFEADIKGDLAGPQISAKFLLDEFSYQDIDVFNSRASGRLALRNLNGHPGLTGEVTFSEGILSLKQIAVQLREGKIVFSGDMNKPLFSFQGHSNVDDVRINVKFKGTKEQPDLQLTSDPPVPSEKLLLMLATNKSWQGLDQLIFENQLSADLVKDIVDFSVFHGAGGKIAQRFGIKDLSLDFDKGKKGLKLRKEIFRNLDVGYEVRQKKAPERNDQIEQKVSGNIQVTEQVSVDVQKGIKNAHEQTAEGIQPQEAPEESILLKYKRAF